MNHLFNYSKNATFCGDYEGAVADEISGPVANASCPDCLSAVGIIPGCEPGDNCSYSDTRIDLESPSSTSVDSGATEKLEGSQIPDPVNSPAHYRQYPVEVIEITEHLNFLLGNVVKYVLRADYKGEPLQDLKKAAWYLSREIEKRERDTP